MKQKIFINNKNQTSSTKDSNNTTIKNKTIPQELTVRSSYMFDTKQQELNRLHFCRVESNNVLPEPKVLKRNVFDLSIKANQNA